jgi:hypothetical protein
MANWLTEGGCFNAARWSNDGAGAGARDWIVEADVSIIDHPLTISLILATSWDSDDMTATDGDFQLQWRNITDTGSWTVLTGSGEVAWASDTDLVNDNAVVVAEELGVDGCSGVVVAHVDGVEREGANAITLTDVASDQHLDLHWALSFDGADGGDQYEFRCVETGTSNSYGTMANKITVGAVGNIAGVTKDKSGGVLVSCYVAVFEKVEGGGPPHNYVFKQSTTSDGATGAYNFSNLLINKEYFVYAVKEDSPHVFDATDDVLTPTGI